MSELKPCPFCGTTDLLVKSAVIAEYYDETPWIACDHCGFRIKVKELCVDVKSSPKENAVWWDKETTEKWNHRPAEDAKDAEIERLKVALKDMCELWESMGKQIPPLLNEQKYLNAKVLTGKGNIVGQGRLEAEERSRANEQFIV